MFRSAERARSNDRARVAPHAGGVSRNVGDTPYIMDLILHEHFLQGDTGPFQGNGAGTGSEQWAFGVTAVVASTGNTASSNWYFDLGTGFINGSGWLTGFTRDANLRARCAWSAVDANAVMLIGFSTSNGINSANDGLFFGVEGVGSTTYFTAVARTGGVGTKRVCNGDGGLFSAPIDTGYHEIQVVCDSQNAEVRYYFDRRLVAIITSDLPDDAADYLQPSFSVENGATATNRTLGVDVIVLSEAAP